MRSGENLLKAGTGARHFSGTEAAIPVKPAKEVTGDAGSTAFTAFAAFCASQPEKPQCRPNNRATARYPAALAGLPHVANRSNPAIRDWTTDAVRIPAGQPAETGVRRRPRAAVRKRVVESLIAHVLRRSHAGILGLPKVREHSVRRHGSPPVPVNPSSTLSLGEPAEVRR